MVATAVITWDVSEGCEAEFENWAHGINREAAQDFVKDRKVTYPSIYDPAMRTMLAFGGKYPTSVIPSTVVLDRQHRVAAIFLRELLAEDLQPVVQRIAAEK